MTPQDSHVLRIALAMAMLEDLQFIYTDADGVPSGRVAHPLSLEATESGDLILRAFDLKREAPRTFRLDRIERIL